MIKNLILSLISTLVLFSCKQHKKSSPEKIQKIKLKETIELSIKEIDSLKTNGLLTKKRYSLMSSCGGGLEGFYFKDNLVYIDAIYEGELGFIKHEFYLKGIKFSKIFYREYLPEDEKYLKKYPLHKFPYDESKMTFSDTIYTINLGKNLSFKKMAKGQIISKKVDEKFIKKLIDWGNNMVKELESDSNLSIDENQEITL